MQLNGEKNIHSPRSVVWAALNDPSILSQCIEGCDSLVWVESNKMSGTVQAKVGPVRATFKGEVTLSNIIPNESYTLTGEGKGGVAGFAKGSASIALSDTDTGGTRLVYNVESAVGGKLAQLGARLMDATAHAYAESFFKKLCELIEQPANLSRKSLEPISVTSEPPKLAGIPPWAWASLTAFIIIALLLVLLHN